MPDPHVFDTLSSQLSSTERKELLGRIRSSAKLSMEPLFPSDSVLTQKTPQGENDEGFGFVSRFVYFFRKLFSGKSVEQLQTEDVLKRMVGELDSFRPGLIDWKRGLLLEGFAVQLRSLRDSSRWFADLFARSIEQDKGAFIACLVSIQLPDIHSRIVQETDPFTRTEDGIGTDATRTAVLAAWEDILRSMTDDRRRSIYTDLRSLMFLRNLSGFLFDRLLGHWKQQPGGGTAANFISTRELLLELGDLLYSIALPPSTELLEALFVTASQEAMIEPDYDAESAMAADFKAGAAALQGIRNFNSRVPIAVLLRLVAGDPGYVPRDLPGGEDWFVSFRTFWKERIEAKLEAYKIESRNRELAQEIKAFLGNREMPAFVNITRDGGGEGGSEGPPLRYELPLALLEGFSQGPFSHEMNRPFKLLLLEGEFYRKDNRIEFTDAYNCLLRLHEQLQAFDAKLGSDGEHGRAWSQAHKDISSFQARRRKAETLRRAIEEEAEALLRDSATALITMTRVLQGVLKGEAGGRYDSLQNLSAIDGRANRDFLKSLDTTRATCETAIALLGELSGLDFTIA
ncbi:MAG: DUF5312 family protein [Spirochaetota bacterium]